MNKEDLDSSNLITYDMLDKTKFNHQNLEHHHHHHWDPAANKARKEAELAAATAEQ